MSDHPHSSACCNHAIFRRNCDRVFKFGTQAFWVWTWIKFEVGLYWPTFSYGPHVKVSPHFKHFNFFRQNFQKNCLEFAIWSWLRFPKHLVTNSKYRSTFHEIIPPYIRYSDGFSQNIYGIVWKKNKNCWYRSSFWLCIGISWWKDKSNISFIFHAYYVRILCIKFAYMRGPLIHTLSSAYLRFPFMYLISS